MSFRIYTKRIVVAALTALMSFSMAPFVNAQTRVIGGQQISIEQAPSIVALLDADRYQRLGTAYGAHYCAGTLIDERWVLTAAHCLFDRDNTPTVASEIRILTGSHDLLNPASPAYEVSQIIVHADYDPEFTRHDIALLELSTAATSAISPLNTVEAVLNERVRVAGWGAQRVNSNDESVDFPPILRGVDVLAVPADYCNSRLPAMVSRVDANQVCAGYPGGRVDTCQGDSGGPLFRYPATANEPLIVAGITSWGNGCARPGNPGVYTNVAAYVDWIEARTGPLLAASDVGVGSAGGSGSVNVATADDNIDIFPEWPAVQNRSARSTLVGAGGAWLLIGLVGMLGLRRIRC